MLLAYALEELPKCDNLIVNSLMVKSKILLVSKMSSSLFMDGWMVGCKAWLDVKVVLKIACCSKES